MRLDHARHLVVAGCFIFSSAANAEKEVRGLDWDFGVLGLRLGGLIQWDTDFNRDIFVTGGQEEGTLPTDDNNVKSELRRTRLDLVGNVSTYWNFRLQWDVAQLAQDAVFDNGEISIQDAWLGYDGLVDGLSLRLGQYKEPFSIERLTPSAYLTTIERTPFGQLFVPERSQGIGLLGSYPFFIDQQVTWQLGGFINDLSDPDDGSDKYVATGRFTWSFGRDLPDIFHLGISGSYRDLPNNVNLVNRLPVNLEVNTVRAFPTFVDRDTRLLITDYRASDVSLLGLEAVVVYGAWSAQGEWSRAYFDGAKPRDEPRFPDYEPYSYYAELSWFPTGEHRNYRPETATFGPIEPDNFYGAFQIYYRWTRGKFKDGDIGDDFSVSTVGANWYPTDRVAFKFSWVHGSLSQTQRFTNCSDETDPESCEMDDSGDVYSIRVQIDF